MSTHKLRPQIGRAFAPLLAASRYKGAWGGRGSGKSHFFAELILARCVQRRTRVACIREVQNSLKESVRQLLVDKIEQHGVGHLFEVLQEEIRGPNGSLIIFKGMQSYNATNIKSLEGYDIAWVEEAQTLSATSLRLLRPTIRKDGSELWFSWNPRFDTDAVDALLRGPHKPSDAIVVEVHHSENPWFPRVLQAELEEDYANDPDNAEHVWGGGYQIVTEGAYYAKALAQAEREGRIGHFPYDPSLKVLTAWDIGVDDYTAVWFIQEDGRQATVIDYYEVSGDGAEQVVQAALPELIPDVGLSVANLVEADRPEPYRYGIHYLPHDVRAREWGAGARKREDTLKGLGVKPIHAGAALGPAERINATRRIMPIVRFHNTKRVQVGISRLRRYARKWNDNMQTFTTPLHDMNSHGADAFGEFAVNCRIVPQKPKPPEPIKKAPGYSSGHRPSTSRDVVTL